MQYEMPVYADGIGKAKQTSFRGLNHNPGAGDGQIYEMRNLCSDYYPLMATRPRRANTGLEFEDVPDALFVDDAVYATVNGYLYRDGVQICEAGSTEGSVMAKLNDYLIMMPGKRYYNEESGRAGSLEAEYTGEETYTGTPIIPRTYVGEIYEPEAPESQTVKFYHALNTIRINGVDWESYTGFSIGNQIEITAGPEGWVGAILAIEDIVDLHMTDYPGKTLVLSQVMTWQTIEPDTVTASLNSVRLRAYEPKEITFTTTATAEGYTTITWDNITYTGADYIEISGCSITENNGRYPAHMGTNHSIVVEAELTEGTVRDPLIVFRRCKYGGIEFRDGTLYGEPAEANTIGVDGLSGNWPEFSHRFHAGDAVEIYDPVYMPTPTTLIIREVNLLEIRFYENSFPNLGVSFSEKAYIRRVVPDMDGIFESGNRLWGWKGKTIYASKLGDPFNFNVFDGLETDSWAVEIGGVGDITGGIEYQGYPTFFREWDLFKVFGSVPSNFEIIRTAETGVKAGSGKSLAVAGETLFYHNRNGIYAYAGGLPGKVSGGFGNVEYEDCVAGSDGQKYYCSMRERGKPAEELDSWHLFVYDTNGGAWHEEDSVRATGFGRYGERFLMSGQLAGSYGGEEVEHGVFSIGRTYYETENLEDPVDWWAEFTDFTDDSPNKKGISKLQIRLEMDEGTEDDPSWVEVKLMCDSDGQWITPEGGRIEEPEKRSYILPIIPRRADHYRLRLEGHGGCRIYSIAREYYQGSDLKSRPGRQ
ncbi:MAG: hypothetical protein IKI35_05780 [Stomatobaculum sp.]|nr:hypothetical protein [Stomatobaculum sp.]MBR7058219.1 hypothetical protein [Stomatobaculum sp.]